MKTILVLFCVIPTLLSQYDKGWSKTLNCYSAITHCTFQQVSTWQCKACHDVEQLQDAKLYDNKIANVFGYSGYMQSKNVILFVWRGTIDVRNWIQDFTFAQIDFEGCKGCKIHEGFYLSYESVSKHAKEGLQYLSAKYPTAKIVVIGSSMGAALAIVNSLDFIANQYKVDELHLFGCPRVANENLAQYITLKIPTVWRVIHYRDIIPHLPLQQQNYHHPPYQILYDQNMVQYKICDQSGQDPTCALAFEPGLSIQDHITYWYQPDKMDICTP